MQTKNCEIVKNKQRREIQACIKLSAMSLSDPLKTLTAALLVFKTHPQQCLKLLLENKNALTN